MYPYTYTQIHRFSLSNAVGHWCFVKLSHMIFMLTFFFSDNVESHPEKATGQDGESHLDYLLWIKNPYFVHPYHSTSLKWPRRTCKTGLNHITFGLWWVLAHSRPNSISAILKETLRVKPIHVYCLEWHCLAGYLEFTLDKNKYQPHFFALSTVWPGNGVLLECSVEHHWRDARQLSDVP